MTARDIRAHLEVLENQEQIQKKVQAYIYAFRRCYACKLEKIWSPTVISEVLGQNVSYNRGLHKVNTHPNGTLAPLTISVFLTLFLPAGRLRRGQI